MAIPPLSSRLLRCRESVDKTRAPGEDDRKLMNLPFPTDEETKSAFRKRWDKHQVVLARYPTLGARLAGLEKTWAKAKAQSLVSIKTELDEVVLFGVL